MSGDWRGESFSLPKGDLSRFDISPPSCFCLILTRVAGRRGGMLDVRSRQVLTEVTSACVVTHLLEVLVIRLGLYLINSPAVVLDLVAYTGYQ